MVSKGAVRTFLFGENKNSGARFPALRKPYARYL